MSLAALFSLLYAFVALFAASRLQKRFKSKSRLTIKLFYFFVFKLVLLSRAMGENRFALQAACLRCFCGGPVEKRFAGTCFGPSLIVLISRRRSKSRKLLVGLVPESSRVLSYDRAQSSQCFLPPYDAQK
eukprot:3350357-Amphidinium_carterae.1